MAKAVFRSGEVKLVNNRVSILSPTSYPDLAHLAHVEEVEEIEEIAEEYTGPTIDDIRREVEEFKAKWESERDSMIRSARAQAEGIIKEAEEAAFQEVKRKTDEAQSLKRAAQDDAEKIIAEAHVKAKEIEEASRLAFEAERKDAEEQGRAAGRETGFTEGKAEVARLIQRTQTVLERAQDKRSEILSETEQEIIDLVLLISRKVIKVISENQRNVVISNVIQALRKVKGRGNILIRVNLSDLKLTSQHLKDYIQILEGAKSIQVIEDTTVDPGGCIIETDFGEIDARISSQLAELETKILEISPIRAKAKTISGSDGP